MIFYTESDTQVWGFGPGQYQLEVWGPFSLFTLTDATFTIQGQCRYPLSPTLIPVLSSRLLSNEGLGLVTILVDQPFFCYRPGAP